MRLYLDTETYSEADLKKIGTYAYATHPTTEVLLLAYAIDDGPVEVLEHPTRDDVAGVLRGTGEVVAHNSMFDRNILRYASKVEVPIDRWRDTMVKAYTLGLPGSLEQLGAVLGMPDSDLKLKTGKQLIQKFCKPRPRNHKVRRLTRETSPADWAQFIEYARQDVATMRHIDRLLPDWNYKGAELALWHLDQAINDRGLPVDVDAARAAIELVETEVVKLNEELRDLTAGAVMAGTQVAQLLDWVQDRGVMIPNLTKSTVTNALARDDIPSDVRRALEIRQQVGRTSTAKYQKLIDAAVIDRRGVHRLHGTLQFCGASRTGRWAGRLFQPQNLPRPTIKDTDSAMDAILAGDSAFWYDTQPMELASSCVRSVVAAPAGKKLTPADLSNIEGRSLAWLVGETWKLEAFQDYDAGTGPDLYVLAYARAFGIAPEDVAGDQRQIGKVMELALGYQGSAGAFASMADAYGMDLDELYSIAWPQAAPEHHDKALWVWDKAKPDMKKTHALVGYALTYAWRDAHPATVEFWGALESAARQAIQNPGRFYRVRSLVFSVQSYKGAQWLLVRLPSGRFLPYPTPRLVSLVKQYADGGAYRTTKITYAGTDQYTRQWSRIDTYGGKLAENVTQAFARDVLADSMPRLEAAGYRIVGSVHDETIPEVEASPEYSANDVARLMSTVPGWAEGLPLAAAGYESKRYRK